MDAQDATETPEWRPVSGFSEAMPEPSSSQLLRPLQSQQDDRASTSGSSEYAGSTTTAATETAQTGRDIAPWEPVTCSLLTEQIRAISAGQSAVALPYSTAAGPQTLSEALRDAAVTIRFNSKWFTEDELAQLIDVALGAAASSSASAALSAGITLIDTVGTYSLLPPDALIQVVRFLTQSYYNATRAHKTKKLADSAWKALQQILESHLGGLCVEALLEILNCRDDLFLESKIGYAQIAGALMVISEHIILRHDADQNTPAPSLVDLLDALRACAVNGTDNVRELIMETISDVLKDEHAVQDLDAQSSWDILLETVEPCVAHTPNGRAARSIVERVAERVDHFERRQWPTIAQLCVDVDLPLTPVLRLGLLEPWTKLLSTAEWMKGFDELLTKLCTSTHYTTELQQLVAWCVTILTLEPMEPPLFAGNKSYQGLDPAGSARKFKDCTHSPQTTKEAAAVLAKGIIKIFRLTAARETETPEVNVLFDVLCSVSGKCSDAAKFLLEVRADVEGVVYTEARAAVGEAIDEPNDKMSSEISTVTCDISSVSLERWDAAILAAVQSFDDWEVYHCFLTGLAPLLGNHTMFNKRIDFIKRLKEILCAQLEAGIYPDPPESTGLTKSYVAIRLLQILTALLSYHRHLSKQDVLSIASVFLNIAGSRDYAVSIPCIHALTICCYELPDLMSSSMVDIIDKMAKMVTQRYLAIHVLLFLSGLSRLPDLFRNFQTLDDKNNDYKKIFGVCGSYLQSIRGTGALMERRMTPSTDQSSGPPADSSDALPQYVYALAHHVIAFWYVALRRDRRIGLKEYITSCLKYTNSDGKETIEDQGLVTIDLMDCVDAIEDTPNYEGNFDSTDGLIAKRHRLVGVLLITNETSLRTKKSIITTRRPTATWKYVMYESHNAETAGDSESILVTMESTEDDFISVMPDDPDGRAYGRIHIPTQTCVLGSMSVLTLPDDDHVTRAIQGIERTSALDSHKAGIIYIGENQTAEDEIFQNAQGSPDYVEFVEALGSLTRLRGATFNTQGLDRLDDADGEHAVIWANNLTELVFHTTTLMPNNEDVLQNTANKKKHTGNDYVNIIFNNSGQRFDFNTFPSQFNAVYIVITPSARTSFLQTRQQITFPVEIRDRFYKVQVLTRPGYPSISSAAEEKVISGASLPGYVRNLALNECVFSLMWSQRDGEAGEYQSSWRSRLDQIRRIRERYG